MVDKKKWKKSDIKYISLLTTLLTDGPPVKSVQIEVVGPKS